MKQLTFLTAIVLSLVACNSDTESSTPVENNEAQTTAPVTVQFNDFSITTEEMSSGDATKRAAVAPASYAGVGAMTLAFYDINGKEVYKTTQIKTNTSTYTTFGSFTADLQVGTYTMVALGYYYNAEDVFTLTSPTEAAFSSERPRETFCKTQTVTVTSAAPLNLSVTLNRIVSALNILSTDNRPASAAKLRTTFSKGGKSFNPTTGLALTDTGFTQTNNPGGSSTIDVTCFPFLTSADNEEEVMNVTIEVLDADSNVLSSHTIENVPFMRNRKTTVRGAIYSADASSAGFHLETSWLPASDDITF